MTEIVYHDSYRQALIYWLMANNIKPNNVPRESVITLKTTETGRTIRHDVFTREDGHFVADEAGECKVETREVPLIVEPPEFWTL